MRFDGADEMHINDSGALVLQVGDTALTLSPPMACQESLPGATRRHISIEARYVMLSALEAGFALGPYDRNRTLIIDPVFSCK